MIYLCERRKLDETKTHFDTNHCTTVIWSEDDPVHSVKNSSQHSGGPCTRFHRPSDTASPTDDRATSAFRSTERSGALPANVRRTAPTVAP